MMSDAEIEAILADGLPDELYRTTSASGVSHLDAECTHIREDSATIHSVNTEYLRRAGYRLCRVCGDGRPLTEGGIER